jgi:hypothetical protein
LLLVIDLFLLGLLMNTDFFLRIHKTSSCGLFEESREGFSGSVKFAPHRVGRLFG